MIETILGGGAVVGVERQHGGEEVGELLGALHLPLVLLGEHLHQAPRLQLGDVA